MIRYGRDCSTYDQFLNLGGLLTDKLMFVCLFIATRAIYQLSDGCHHCRWQSCKFRPILGAQGLWAGFSFVYLFLATRAIFQLSDGCQHYRWQDCKFRPMLGTQGLWAGRGLYRATPTSTRDLSFYGLIRHPRPTVGFESPTQGSSDPCARRSNHCATRATHLSREGSLSCHTYCDTGPRFIRSHPKDRNPRPSGIRTPDARIIISFCKFYGRYNDLIYDYKLSLRWHFSYQ
jgi:hypothetical protein